MGLTFRLHLRIIFQKSRFFLINFENFQSKPENFFNGFWKFSNLVPGVCKSCNFLYMTSITPIEWLESTISLYSPKWAFRWLKTYTLFSQIFVFFRFFQNFPNFWTYNRKFEKPVTCAWCLQIAKMFIYDINNTLNVIRKQNYLIFIEISCFRRIKRRDPVFHNFRVFLK